MSRSESNTAGTLPWGAPVPVTKRGAEPAGSVAADLEPVVPHRDHRSDRDMDHRTGRAPGPDPLGRGDHRTVGGASVADEQAALVEAQRQVGLGYGAALVRQLDQL